MKACGCFIVDAGRCRTGQEERLEWPDGSPVDSFLAARVRGLPGSWSNASRGEPNAVEHSTPPISAGKRAAR